MPCLSLLPSCILSGWLTCSRNLLKVNLFPSATPHHGEAPPYVLSTCCLGELIFLVPLGNVEETGDLPSGTAELRTRATPSNCLLSPLGLGCRSTWFSPSSGYLFASVGQGESSPYIYRSLATTVLGKGLDLYVSYIYLGI